MNVPRRAAHVVKNGRREKSVMIPNLPIRYDNAMANDQCGRGLRSGYHQRECAQRPLRPRSRRAKVKRPGDYHPAAYERAKPYSVF
jgi:hypothetical protein